MTEEPWLDEFMNAMLERDFDKVALERAFALKAKNIPARLYRYRSITPRELATLANDEVWLGAADKFNDPFDSMFATAHKEVWAATCRKNIESILKEGGFDESLKPDDREAVTQAANPMTELARRITPPGEDPEPMIAVLDQLVDKFIREPFDALQASQRARMSLCSFTPDPLATLMWSHYARNHTGMCIEYDFGRFEANDVRRRMLFPVKYASSMFDATPHFVRLVETGRVNVLLGMMPKFFKSPEWAYEREWRLVIPIDERLYPMCRPTRVLLGAKVSDEDRQAVERVTAPRRIATVQVRMADNDFGLSIPAAPSIAPTQTRADEGGT